MPLTVTRGGAASFTVTHRQTGTFTVRTGPTYRPPEIVTDLTNGTGAFGPGIVFDLGNGLAVIYGATVTDLTNGLAAVA